jgi:hypothetical protein
VNVMVGCWAGEGREKRRGGHDGTVLIYVLRCGSAELGGRGKHGQIRGGSVHVRGGRGKLAARD